jgi:pimeloyl-ACP methyl ester carboxylesterase
MHEVRASDAWRPKMQEFQHDGVTIAYERAGSGPAILFLHNGGTSSTIWRNQVRSLSDSSTVVAVDLPGFGRSPRPTEGIDLDDHVALITALIEELDLVPVLLVGNCMGSNIASLVAAAHPDHVRGLVLVNPLTEATFSAGGLGTLHKLQRWASGPSAAARRLSRRVVPPRLAAKATVRFQLGSKGAAARLQDDPELLACNVRRDQMPALVDVLDDMHAYGSLDDGRTGDLPLCVVWGAQNRVLAPKAMRALSAQLRPDRQVVMDGCGHLPMLEDPGRMTSIIGDFMADVDAHAASAEATTA